MGAVALAYPAPTEESFAGLPPPIAQALAADLESGNIDIPLLPEVASQVMSAIADEKSDAKTLAGVISRDQAMSAHLLRVANSAMYGRGNAITTVQQAVSRLGMGNLRQVAFLITCKSKLFTVKGYDTEVRQLFRLAFGSALYAQHIATLKRKNGEDAFLSGLMHDVGRTILLQKISELSARLKCPVKKETLMPLLDAMHPLVGGALASKWNLGEGLGQAILHHHEEEPPPECRETVRVIQLADLLARFTMNEPEITELTIQRHRGAVELDLSVNDVTILVAKREAIRLAMNEMG